MAKAKPVWRKPPKPRPRKVPKRKASKKAK